MTFKSLLAILAFGLICLEAVSRAFAAGPAASHTTITNTIDIMGAVESAQENKAGGYGGQIVYSRYSDDEKMISSASKKRPDVGDRRLIYPDVFNSSKTLTPSADPPLRIPASMSKASANVAQDSRPFYSSSYITASSGPSITVSTTGSDAHIISYSGPGGVFLSHGYPGSSYVLSARRSPQPLAIYYPPLYYSPENNPRSNFGTRSALPSSSSSSELPARGYVLRSGPSPVIAISGGSDSSAIVDVSAGSPGAADIGVYGDIGHEAYAAAERNLEAARRVVDGISSTVYRALNINLPRFGAAR